MSQIDTKIGPKIKAFRRQLGIQANKLAEEMSISPSYLNLIESGKRKIDGDLLLRVCDKLKIELSDLTSKINLIVDFVNIVNYKVYMEKNKINNIENNYQITNIEEHSEHKSKGIYIRDDHCDWGSSGMNEFTEEYSSK